MHGLFFRTTVLVFLISLVAWPGALWAHGVVGQRFFPAGIVVDDPFPADELTLASPSTIKTPNGRETAVGFEVQKRLSPNLGLAIGDEYASIKPEDPANPTLKGFSNPEFSLIYSMFESPDHEYIASTAIHVSPGGIGKEGIREEMSHVEPALMFGKGLGDLPDSFGFLRPIGIVGQAGVEVPWGHSDNPDDLTGTLHYGLVVEYSIPYLQSFVKDVGIPWPFNKMFPIVELTYSEPISGPDAHHGATGYLNPGIVWAGKYIELGLEAQIPLNDRTGQSTGVIGLVHLFLDNIAPSVFSWTPFPGTLGSARQ
ncbi:MAG: hypothetical protein HY283_03995 [Nitrospirae bacterium]|nr:hypothetical protein [Nitrospirota bacterium]